MLVFAVLRFGGMMESSHGFTAMFLHPEAVLESLKERPRWFCALFFAAAYTAAVNLYLVWRLGLVRLLSNVLKANAALDPQSAVSTLMARKTQVLLFQSGATLVTVFVTSLVIAKVLWLVLQVIGNDVLFKRVLAVVAHSTLLTVFLRQSMLALTATVMQNLDDFSLTNPLATNMAFFTHPDSLIAARLLQSLDLLTFANIFLIAFGLSKVADRLPVRGACVLVSVPWAVYTFGSLFLPVPAL